MKKFFLLVATMFATATMSVNAQSVNVQSIFDYDDNDLQTVIYHICSQDGVQNMPKCGKQYVCLQIDVFLTNHASDLLPAQKAKLEMALKLCRLSNFSDAQFAELIAYMAEINLGATMEWLQTGMLMKQLLTPYE